MLAVPVEQIAKWRASANLPALAQRAEILAQIRNFFGERDMLEVETPVLEQFACNEAGIEKFMLDDRYLRTSNEVAMKRLLASGCGDIYQLGKVFRRNEIGRLHNPEFAMLEWYRAGYDYRALMTDADELIRGLLKPYRELSDSVFISCRTLFKNVFNFDLLEAPDERLLTEAYRAGLRHSDDSYDAFDFLVDTAVRNSFDKDRLTFLYDYPESNALLAKVSDGIAQRFEVYSGDMELANGYTELTDADEFLKRFEKERQREQERRCAETPFNEVLYAVLQDGLPECAGASLGVDRLILLALGKRDLSEVIAFSWARA